MSSWRVARSNDDDAVVALCLALNAEDPGQDRVAGKEKGTFTFFARQGKGDIHIFCKNVNVPFSAS